MTEQAIDLDALAADLTAAGLECHIESDSVFADTPKKRNRIQRRWRITSFGHMFQGQFNWGEWGPSASVLVDDWKYLDIIRRHVAPMYAQQGQMPFASTAADLHASLIEIFNANTTPNGAGNATCFDFDGVAAADAILQLIGYPAIERPRRAVSQAEEEVEF